MTPSQITRTINWIAMPIALAALGLVSLYIYQQHFLQTTDSRQYQFDDLPTATTPAVTADINAIISQHLFGQQPKTPPRPVANRPAPSSQPKPAPRTRLNLKVTGIIDGSSPENGMAILEVERGKTLVVAVGEKIGDTDAVLHQVLPGEILIDRGGTIESVKMERESLSLASLDPALSSNSPQLDTNSGSSNLSNLPQPHNDQNRGARNRPVTSSKARSIPLPEASTGYQQDNRTEAARSGVLVRYPRQKGFMASSDEDRDEDDERGEDGDSISPGKLPIPRALRN